MSMILQSLQTRPSILRRLVSNLSPDQGPARVDTVVANLLIRVGHEFHDLLLDTDVLQEPIHKQQITNID